MASGIDLLIRAIFVALIGTVVTGPVFGQAVSLRPIHSMKVWNSPIRHCAIVDNKRVAIVTGNELVYYDIEKNSIHRHSAGELLYAVLPVPVRGIVATGGWDGIIRQWDSTSNKIGSTIKAHRSSIYGLAVSPDGRIVASGGHDNVVRLWEGTEMKELQTFEGHSEPVWCLAFSPNGKYVASGSYDCSVIVWDIAGRKKHLTLPDQKGVVRSIGYLEEGKKIVTGCGERLVLYHSESGKALGAFEVQNESIMSIAVRGSGRVLFVGDGTHPVDGLEGTGSVYVVDSEKMKAVHVYQTKSIVTSMCETRDGSRLITGEQDGTIRVWEIVTSKP